MIVRVRQKRGEATRRAILNAAEMEFATKGFEGASMRSIARTCGIELALVQYHFGEKLALWDAVLGRIVGDERRQWGRIYARIKDWAPAKILTNFIESLIRHAAGHPNFVAIMSHARLAGSAYSRIFVTHLREDSKLLIRLIAQAQREGTFIAGRPELLFYMMVGSALRVFMVAADAKELGVNLAASGFVDEHVRTCTSLFMPSTAGAEAAVTRSRGRTQLTELGIEQHRSDTRCAAPDAESASPGSPSTFYLLTSVDGVIRKRLESELRELGITLGQMMALIRIADEHRLSSARLARALDVSPQNVNLFVKSLEAQGLIVRGHGKANQKVLEIELTNRGYKALEKLHHVVADSQVKLLEGLTFLERDLLHDLLTRILERHRPQALTEWSPLLSKEERQLG